DKFYLAKRYPKGTMQLDRHPEFVAFLNSMERAEIAFHGLYHCHKGIKIPVEFQDQTQREFKAIIEEMIRIFNKSGVKYANGICPPGWNAPDNLLNQLAEHNIRYINSARDIITTISQGAKTNMSGIKGEPLIYPSLIKNNRIVHFPANFQATSKPERAREILDHNGLLSIKAHIIKSAFGHIALDGVDQIYMNYLDVLLTSIDQDYGDKIWWTSMGEITDYIYSANNLS
ncbi:MAG: DUF2334 domain-containing protein, partial [Bacteroidia bacterium]